MYLEGNGWRLCLPFKGSMPRSGGAGGWRQGIRRHHQGGRGHPQQRGGPRRLKPRSHKAKGFRWAWLAALTAQVPHLEDPQLAELAVELHRYHVLDQRLWKALADSVLRRTEL